MRFLVLVGLIIISSLKVNGQEGLIFFQCASDEVHKEWLAKDEHNSLSEENDEKEYVSSLSHGSYHRNLEYYVLPIVVHIVHDGGPENIFDLQILESISNLNDAFRNVGYYNPSNGEDTRISFCLAARSPGNQPTNGITRSFSNLTDVEYETEDSSLKDLIRWPSKDYINIWVVKNICFYGDCRIAGYSTSPGAHGFPSDGIVIEAAYFGTSPALTSSFIHEMGHFLGLAHTFQGGCSNANCLTSGDRVCDTPPDNATGYFPCNYNYNSCTTDAEDLDPINPYRPVALGGLGDQPDMHQNYMDYGASECFDRFTLGQVERMHFFLGHQRKSLARSLGCFPPCGSLPIANFVIPGNEFLVDDVITLSNNSTNYVSNTWLINDQVLTNAQDTSVSFDSEGVYLITLVVNSSAQGCGSDTFTQEVIITCPTSSIFDYSLSNDSIFLNNNSINTTTVEWSITFNNVEVFTSNESIDTFHFEESGYYQICLTAHGATCEDIKCEFVRVYKSGIEDCQNGIDDDGDGLIDLFDNECQCTPSSYQAFCPVDCLFIPDSFPNISLKLKWESERICDFDAETGNLICGDIDGDGNVEVISSTLFGMHLPYPPWASSLGGIGMLAGSDGHTISSFNFTPDGVAYGSMNMGIIKDPVSNNADIIFHNYNSNRIVRYDRYGNKKWESETIGAPYGATINFADFNADGIPELYLNRMIFNAETGKILAVGKEGIGGNKIGFAAQYNAIAHSLAADLLPSPGLELAAGNTVYIVELNNLSDSVGNRMIPIISNTLKDGLTGLADFDGDQQLDVVLVRSNNWTDGGGVSIWNPRTGSLIATGPAGIGGGIPAIGDLDGDCKPEIVVAFEDELKIYNYLSNGTLEKRFTFSTKERSGCTSLALFDFNLDGILEIVYRDEEYLYIIDGYAGIVLDSYPVFSGTYLEGPIIADIDNDGSAEIIVNGSLSGYTDISVFAFESGGKPWAPARSIWNQYGYHVTNVNDDLSIPKEPQNFAKHISGASNCSLPTCEGVYNAFMNQATKRTQEGCIQFPAKDLQVGNLMYNCSPDSLTLCFSIENIGSVNLDSEQVFITAWGSNPFQANASQIFVKQANISLNVGEVDTLCLSELLLFDFDSIFLVVNDFGSISPPYLQPSTTFDECDYQNNMISIALNLSPLILDIGPDITKCNSSVVTLSANDGFQSYLWSDGSASEQFSTSFAGLYFVQTTDECSRIYTDSVQIFIDEPAEINLGPDQIVCPLDTLEFSLSNTFEWTQWITSASFTCDTCHTIQVASDSSFLVIALGGMGDCIVQDSVHIEIIETVTIEADQFICSTECFEFFGDTLSENGTYSYLTPGCDSLFMLNLSVGEGSTSDILSNICEGDSVEIGGQWIANEGNYIIELSDANGCDSIINFTLSNNPNLDTLLAETICIGDSTFFGDTWLYNEGIYSTTKLSRFGCDSIIQLDLKVETEVIQMQEFNLCDGDSIQLNNEWQYTSGLYLDTIQQTECDLILHSLVSFQPNYVKSETISICGKDSIWLINNWIHSAGVYSIELLTLHGCDSTFNFTVEDSPIFPDPSIEIDCQLLSVTISIAGDSTLHVSWDNGDTSLQTTYLGVDSARWSIFYDPLCKGEFALPLPAVPGVSFIPDLADTTIAHGTSILIDLNLDPVAWKIRWQTDGDLSCDTCSSVIIFPENGTEVRLHLTHLESGCTYDEAFRVFVTSEDKFYVPNIFSPNGDGINDNWTISLNDSNIEFNSVEIFDRWGNQVANWNETNTIQWDGVFKGKPLQSGVYAYVIKYTNSDDISALKKGTITLLK